MFVVIQFFGYLMACLYKLYEKKTIIKFIEHSLLKKSTKIEFNYYV